jgi:hypothetical protein
MPIPVFALGLLVVGVATLGCRRGASAPDLEGDADARVWQAPPPMAPADAESVWLRRLIGDHHDWVAYLDEPAMVADPSVQVVFERVRGRLLSSEQSVSVLALGGPDCSARGGCRDRLVVMAGDGVDGEAPLDDSWTLIDSIDGGDVYVPADAEEPIMVRWAHVAVIAHGYDKDRAYAVLDEHGGPPARVRIGPGIVALRQFSGGYVFRADPASGKGRGVARSTTWITQGEGPSTWNATVYEAPHLATTAAQAVASGAATSVGEPTGQIVDHRGTLLVSRASIVSFAEDLMRSSVAGSPGTARR